ncbi:DUF418 domain-containing protein [Deinococcus misasensis]|uniref:DUF418 domain-containing protein n=1 Tax=Deinococcus misasensis TaxID=392413 RepID=UPI0005587BAA|nr:DUF418 domain-containing protein [Deinococcus misasensis]
MQNRITAIDTLRGFALLGILLMNITSFSMPIEAYYNPNVYGGQNLWNQMVFGLMYVLADQKFMALFSMLFGASMLLLIQKLEQKGQPPARVHYTRNGWLLLFGILHMVFLWEGDILLVYALCSFVLFFFRRMPARGQLVAGLLVFFSPVVLNLQSQQTLQTFTPTEMQKLEQLWNPPASKIQQDIRAFQGTYGQQLSRRLTLDASSSPSRAEDLFGLLVLTDGFARAFGMMLVGMALYNWGIITGKASRRVYLNMAGWGLGIGLPLSLVALFLQHLNDWEVTYSLFTAKTISQVYTPLMACGYLGVVMLWIQSGLWSRLQNRLALVGQMALSNYIGQSVLANLIFYGLDLFGQVNRLQQLGMVLLIWVFQIQFSGFWMQRFQHGPLEWLWRTLTYRKRAPLVRSSNTRATEG